MRRPHAQDDFPDKYEVMTAMDWAFVKGWRVAESALAKAKNPYGDVRADYHESVTFSRAFWRRWNEGWDAYHAKHSGDCLSS